MISLVTSQSVGTLLICLFTVCGVVGSSSKNHFGSEALNLIDASEKPSDLCELLGQAKKTLLSNLKLQFEDLLVSSPPAHFQCQVNDNCSNLACHGLYKGQQIKAGMTLELCNSDSLLKIWVDLSKSKKWSHTFHLNQDYQRVRIIKNTNSKELNLKENWFFNVLFDMSESNYVDKSLRLIVDIQHCGEPNPNSLCETISLIYIPKRVVTLTCDFYYGINPEEILIRKKRSSIISSRNPNLDVLHTQTQKNASSSYKIGDACDSTKIFECGQGAACTKIKNETSVCKCLSQFEEVEKKCIKRIDPIVPDPQPSSDSVNTGGSFSAALGALLSVCILLALAAGVFFGTKYHIFSRIRSSMRIPLSLRFPRFRRSTPFEDNSSLAFAVPLE